MGRNKERYLSFTFDDGCINSAKKVDRILHPHKATFYIVTGWVRPDSVPVSDFSNIHTDHGHIDDWRKLASKGHDIASHTVSHVLPTNPDAEREYNESLDYIKKIHKEPYNFAFPYDVKSLSKMTCYDSVRIGGEGMVYNDLESIDLYNIRSWSPIIQKISEKEIWKLINKAPNNSWLVLEMHALDGEGLFPWPSDDLERLKDFIINCGFSIKTIGEMVNLIRKTQSSLR